MEDRRPSSLACKFSLPQLKKDHQSHLNCWYLLIHLLNLDLINELVSTNNLDDFDDLFSIEEVKIYKPDSKVYDLPINKYKIQPKEVVFLSANTWDVSGGGNFGYNAVWVNRNNSHFDNLDYKPKKEIKNLKGLLEIV